MDAAPEPFPLNGVSHGVLDAVRRARPYAVVRRLDGDIWAGINPGLPWSPEFEVLAEGGPRPAWYAVVGGAPRSATIVEYGSPQGLFADAVGAVAQRYSGLPVRANLTDPVLAAAAEPFAAADDTGPPLWRLLRSPLLDRGAAPVTSWLDRL